MLMPITKPCDPPKIRNIPYHGNTSVFKSKVMRLLKKTDDNESMSGGAGLMKSRFERQMELDLNYIHMVQNPKRNPISYPTIDFTPQPREIHFFSTERRMKRTKLRSNKRVGFMSACPRFKHLSAIAKEDFEKTISPNLPKLEPYKIKLPEQPRLQALRQLPRRLEMLRNVKETTEKFNSFEPLPKANILVNENLFIANKSLDKINKNLNLQQFLKDEYIEKLGLGL